MLVSKNRSSFGVMAVPVSSKDDEVVIVMSVAILMKAIGTHQQGHGTPTGRLPKISALASKCSFIAGARTVHIIRDGTQNVAW